MSRSFPHPLSFFAGVINSFCGIDIPRRSGLHVTTQSVRRYARNRKDPRGCLYSDDMIFSPLVSLGGRMGGQGKGPAGVQHDDGHGRDTEEVLSVCHSYQDQVPCACKPDEVCQTSNKMLVALTIISRIKTGFLSSDILNFLEVPCETFHFCVRAIPCSACKESQPLFS